ncbi:MAG: hypothetical protein JWN14_2183 [Chthonomonadales bacterium]|nr:hypothetical protein [Chthonomonadales bacterium]
MLASCVARASSLATQYSEPPQTPLLYRLSIPGAALHRLHFQIIDDMPPGEKVEFAIPAWSPGYYQILHYEADIEHVRAKDGNGRLLAVTHPSPRVWAIEPSPAAAVPTRIVVDYDVYAHDAGLGFFGSNLDGTAKLGYINGASAFLYEVGKTQHPVRLEATLPTGWKLATPLTPIATPPATIHTVAAGQEGELTRRFEAESYDALIDCPLQFGQFTSTEFVSDGATFQCVCVGSADWDKARVNTVLGKIVHAGIQVFGKPAFARYVFFYHIGGKGFEGGLEHRNSTVIHLSEALKDGKSEEFQTVTAHEFFHAWNVKRLRPTGLGPFDYTQPVRTASLWWAEGVTDYYADLIVYRAGLRDKSWLLKDLAERMEELDNNPARLRVTLEDASRKAWEGKSDGFDGLSYYLKGSLVGLYFDLRLRALSEGSHSLDDVMRLLDTEFGSKNKAYPEPALLTGLESLSHRDFHSEYADLLTTSKEIDWNAALEPVGLTLHRDANSFLGVQLHAAKGDGILIDAIETGSAANRCGVQAGDTLLEIDGEAISFGSFKEQFGHLAPRTPIQLTVLRNGKQIKLSGDSGVRYSHYRLILRQQNADATPLMTLFLPTAAKSPIAP